MQCLQIYELTGFRIHGNALASNPPQHRLHNIRPPVCQNRFSSDFNRRRSDTRHAPSALKDSSSTSPSAPYNKSSTHATSTDTSQDSVQQQQQDSTISTEPEPEPTTQSSSPSITDWWDHLPSRYKVIAATSLSFVICNMDKVNISIAIIPMAQDYGWSPTIAGLVQSSFFYGYFLSQLPGGSLTNAIGGRKTLPGGVALWSLATASVPLLASTLPGLYLSRAAVGLGEGIAPAAATDMVARVISTEERSRAISFVFGGLHVGSLLGLLVAPYIIETFGWESVFYLFGVVGLGWCVWWEGLMDSLADDEVMKKLTAANDYELLPPSGSNNSSIDVPSSSLGGSTKTPPPKALPWRAFLRNGPVRALSFTHFCNNWFHYTMLAWLPTYFIDTLSLDLTRAAQLSLLPPIAAIACSAVAGPAADTLIERGVEVEKVRKAAQSTAFLIPAAFLLAAGVLTNSLPSSGVEGEFSLSISSSGAVVALITMALGVASFSLAGLYCNHADLSPRYAPVLLGLTNTSGALPGIAGVATTGALYDATGSWPLALFAPSVVFFVLGTGVFVRFGSSERQDFDGEEVNRPFRFEEIVSKIFKK